MDVAEAIRARRSIRGYKPDPVPRKILREIMDIAIQAPSTMNTQPWEITVVSGETLDNIREGNIVTYASMAESEQGLQSVPYEGVYRQRQVGLAINLFKLMEIAREDKGKREWWTQRGFRFFDAPAAIILSIDKTLESRINNIIDIGSIVQTICLAALKYGLGTCIEDQGTMFPEVIRKYTGIPESKRILVGIAIGYPDWDFPANRLGSQREPLDNIVTWLGGA